MKIVDGDGNPISNLENLEPWVHFVQDRDDIQAPIVKIEYKRNSISIEWGQWGFGRLYNGKSE